MIRVAQLLLVASAAGLWVASRLPWVVLRTFDGLGQPRTITLTGATWSTALVPLAVLLLAAAVAALAVRGWLLRVLAVVVAATSAGAGYLAVTMWTIGDVALRATYLAVVPVASLVGSERNYVGPAITAVVAVACLAAAVLLMRAAVKGSASTSRYSTPAQRRVAVEGEETRATMSERTMWDALDDGSDPTYTRETEGR
jgi:uncharacterized membrane protein (TIGR02234 family)